MSSYQEYCNYENAIVWYYYQVLGVTCVHGLFWWHLHFLKSYPPLMRDVLNMVPQWNKSPSKQF